MTRLTGASRASRTAANPGSRSACSKNSSSGRPNDHRSPAPTAAARPMIKAKCGQLHMWSYSPSASVKLNWRVMSTSKWSPSPRSYGGGSRADSNSGRGWRPRSRASWLRRLAPRRRGERRSRSRLSTPREACSGRAGRRSSWTADWASQHWRQGGRAVILNVVVPRPVGITYGDGRGCVTPNAIDQIDSVNFGRGRIEEGAQWAGIVGPLDPSPANLYNVQHLDLMRTVAGEVPVLRSFPPATLCASSLA